ncbi:1-acyl-sn-glycerol-3-phosphate acyltransferase [Gillisia mitskevichiae]|uniref:1-acyl-sn-glycerol-3-phosphate acyltransferase n=1 Tax=Gillisia mitskevichiae TaxID=270921 RepID=A0A495PWV1_9FLAO|nr:1-acyl-sn-glycerol-3-phosphate acyltransferase [Gillisia mitskevichiae]RKS53229.1 1-acyl-sn-glycerol-3-phosphate acyltransferase [Gillisia mitskevichiae]
MSFVSKFIFYKVFKWRIEGVFDPNIKKCVFIVAPHTSWWDFFLGVITRNILGIEINFVGKKELFKPPFGWYFKWMGGAPVDRVSKEKKVAAIASIFESKNIFRLALSPEGTRQKTDRWRTGFYYIAQAANVPIIMVAFDYGKKAVRFSKPYYTTGDIEKDLPEIKSFYKDVQGKFPNQF